MSTVVNYSAIFKNFSNTKFTIFAKSITKAARYRTSSKLANS